MRWSDRREDFRTEVLGLMKAQMVKNARDRPGRRQGRLRGQAPAGRRRSRGADRGGDRVLPDLPVGTARRDRQHRRRRGRSRPTAWSATTTTTRTWSSPPTRARPRFSDIANEISESYGFWLGDAFASGGSQGYDHKAMGITAARRVGVGQAPLPRARRRHPERRLHRGRHRRHVRRRVRQRDAAVAPHQAGRRVQPPARLPRSRSGPGGELRGARAPVRAAALVVDRLRPGADLRRRRRVPAHREVDPGVDPRSARRSGSRTRSCRPTS